MTGVTIRVVRLPSTGELLDQYYRERGLVHGSNTEDIVVRAKGTRKWSNKTESK